MSNPRIQFLDGLRGVAIIGVLVFHAYVSGPEFLPFGDRYGGVIPLRLGWQGVRLFFLISGFVILMTLEKCDGIIEFGVRRWLRLFPAMLLASILILAFDTYIRLGPHANRTILDAIPGLTFLSPALIHAVTGAQLQSLEPPFWSLYVEVAFYVVFGLAYFAFGGSRAIAIIFAMALASYLANVIDASGFGGSIYDRIAKAMDWMGFTEFGWFASGALFYRYYLTKRRSLFYLAISIAVISVLITGVLLHFDTVDRIGLLLVAAIFTCTVQFEFLQRAVSNRALLFFGLISYPLYLIHDNMLVATENVVARHLPDSLQFASPFLPIAALCVVSWTIAVYYEPAFRMLIRQRHSYLSFRSK